MSEHESKLNPMAQAFVPLNRVPPVPLFVNPQLQQTPPPRPFHQHQLPPQGRPHPHQLSPKLAPQVPSPPRPGLPPPVPLFVNPDLLKPQPLPTPPPLFHGLPPNATLGPGGLAQPLFPPPPGQPGQPGLPAQRLPIGHASPPTMLGADPGAVPRPLFPPPGAVPLQPGAGPTALDFQRFQQQFAPKRPAGQPSPPLGPTDGAPFRMPGVPSPIGPGGPGGPPLPAMAAMAAMASPLGPGPLAGPGGPAQSLPPPNWVPGAPLQPPAPARPDRPPEPLAPHGPGAVSPPHPKPGPGALLAGLPPGPAAGKGAAGPEGNRHVLQQLSQLQLQQGASLSVQYFQRPPPEAGAPPAPAAGPPGSPAPEPPKAGAGPQQLQQLLSILPKTANVAIRESSPAEADATGAEKDKDRPDLPPDPSILSAGPLLPKGTFDEPEFDEELEARGTRYCFNCGGTDHTVKSCRHPLFCTHCRRYGHTSNVCFKKQAEDEGGEEEDKAKPKEKEAKPAAVEEKEGKTDTKASGEAKAGYLNMDRRRPGAEEAVRGRVGCFNCGSGEHTAKMCPEPLFCTLCKNKGHTANKCKRCHNCGGYHLLSECTKPRVCSKCQKEGHTANVCNSGEGRGDGAGRARAAPAAEDEAAPVPEGDQGPAPEEPPATKEPPSGDAEVNRILGQLGLLRHAAVFAEFGVDLAMLKGMKAEDYAKLDVPEKAYSRIMDVVA